MMNRMESPTTPHEAAEQLRAIRALMERATIYRALSAPAAVVAGLVSLGLCAVQARVASLPAGTFAGQWLAVLAAVTALNFWLLWRSAQGRGEPFVSGGMKLALRAIAPPLLAGFALGLRADAASETASADIAGVWIVCYGLALLAAASFAPRSMRRLGRVFFGAGLLFLIPAVQAALGAVCRPAVAGMALTFGLLHLGYGAAVFLGARQANRPAA